MWASVKGVLSLIGRSAGKGISFLTLIMVVTMFVSTMLSNFFNTNFIALQESVTWMHAAVFMIGAAYTLQHNEHVRVDIFYQRFSSRTQATVDILGTLIFLLPVSIFILVSSWKYVSLSWKLSEASAEAGGLPGVYLLKTLVLVMPILLIIEGLHQLMINGEKWVANSKEQHS
ncbi:TRAP transporter small permease subunit [Pleionea sediminis]|uniref:TRAP transporter small permease subunit n=1 Tax=Pleionea sediminis TaxID=2569479 RepID=UPI001186D048|nr:TRAP transporter small permease subunit [Pleionea sediminis]